MCVQEAKKSGQGGYLSTYLDYILGWFCLLRFRLLEEDRKFRVALRYPIRDIKKQLATPV